MLIARVVYSFLFLPGMYTLTNRYNFEMSIYTYIKTIRRSSWLCIALYATTR